MGFAITVGAEVDGCADEAAGGCAAEGAMLLDEVV